MERSRTRKEGALTKATVLGVLAAVSLGGVACSVDAGEEQSAQQEAGATAATWPTRFAKDRGCVGSAPIPSGPYAGKHLRLRFPSDDEVWLQFYDPSTGLLFDQPHAWSVRTSQDGRTLQLIRTTTTTDRIDGMLTRRELPNGDIAIELDAGGSPLEALIGGAPLRVGCDVDPGARPLESPRAPTLAAPKPVPPNASYPFPVPAGKTCMATGAIGQGVNAGNLLRLLFMRSSTTDQVFISAEIYSRDTGYIIDSTGWEARPREDGGYALGRVGTQSSFEPAGSLVPMVVDGATVLVLDPQRDDVISGLVPLACDFLP